MTTIDSDKLKNIKCSWTTPVLGVDGNLLYFGPLLKKLSNKFKAFTVYTSEYKGNIDQTPFNVKICGEFKRLYKNERFTKRDTEAYIKGFSVASPAILKALLYEKADLIVINEFSLFSFYAALAKFFTKSKVLCIVESRPRFTGGPLSGLMRLVFRKIICATSSAFLTNNKDGFLYLTEDLGVNNRKIITKPYLVSDLSGNKNNNADLPNPYNKNKINLLYVGQLIKRKGLHLAIESINLLSDECKKRIAFNIVGDGSYKDDLEELANSYGLQNIVIFHGRVKYEELYNYYKYANAFIFPTLNDYRALSPFEALSYGLPIFASVHDGGISETVIDNANGHAFDPNNTQQLGQALEAFIPNKDKQSKYSLKSQEMAKSYNLDSAIQALTEACELALSDH